MKLLQLAFLLGIVILSSCRKGENDPFLSLKSRDARLTGKWELTNLKYIMESSEENEFFKETYSDSNVFLDGKFYKTSFNTYMYQQNHDTVVVNDTISPYSHIIEIDKDGTFKLTITEGTEITENGQFWSWGNAGKKKVILLLDEDQYQVDRLTNAELILKTNRDVNGKDGDILYKLKSSGTMTFKKTK